jgi:hypothetical protein
VYKTDSVSKAKLVNALGGFSVNIQNGQAIADKGVFTFYNVIITAMPGSKVKTKMIVEGMETFGNNLTFVDTPVQFSIDLRGCNSGEQL